MVVGAAPPGGYRLIIDRFTSVVVPLPPLDCVPMRTIRRKASVKSSVAQTVAATTVNEAISDVCSTLRRTRRLRYVMAGTASLSIRGCAKCADAEEHLRLLLEGLSPS